ncbi:MAG TPA: hypothetical protein VGE45_12710 [Chloroflexia bacterium]
MKRNLTGNTHSSEQTATNTHGKKHRFSHRWLVRALVIALVIGMAVGGGGNPAYAAGGDLDTTFSGDGRVTADFLSHPNQAYDVAIQSDGKIVTAGDYSTTNTTDFFVTRHNTDGSLDTSFDDNGIQIVSFTELDFAYAVAVQSDGKIVVAGTTGSSKDFAVARLNSNGSLDTSFSGDGKVTTDFGSFAVPSQDEAQELAIQSDGKIVAVGNSEFDSHTRNNFALVRYTTNGSLDTSFSGDGKVTTDFEGGSDRGLGLAIQSDGKIVAAGTAGITDHSQFALSRYTTSGNLDTGFSGDGKVITEFVYGGEISAVAIQSDGKIVAAGGSGGSSTNFTLVRYTTNGSLDTSFSGDGKVTTDFGGNADRARGVAIQSDGKIVAGGTAGSDDSPDGNLNFALARYTTNGSLDTSFSGDGKVTTDFGSASYDVGRGVALQSDGKIVVVGCTFSSSTSYDVALARYQATP